MKTPKPFKRKLHINGKEWSYRVGKGSIVVRTPDPIQTFVYNLSDVLNLSWDDIERIRWKNPTSERIQVTPSCVKDFIESLLLKGIYVNE